MDNNVLVLLLIGHVLGDYYLQNDRLAEGKRKHLNHLFLHGLIYFLVSLVLVFFLGDFKVVLLVIFVTLSHLLIDLGKHYLGRMTQKRGTSKKIRLIKRWDDQGIIYCVDQLLHILILMVLSLIFRHMYGPLDQWTFPFGSWMIRNDILRYILAILLIMKPTNITFRALFEQNKPADKVTFVKDLNTGKRIGNMERLMIFAFMALGQYTAIGLVFTAKSFTRYKRISDDTAFAEYYLLGTLFSILATLVVYITLFVIG